jgi:hypothetical protein
MDTGQGLAGAMYKIMLIDVIQNLSSTNDTDRGAGEGWVPACIKKHTSGLLEI